MTTPFQLLCEIEPPTTPDLGIVREQIAVLQPHCDAFLVPDSHLGRATVSSIAVAHEVAYLQGRAVACLNARDRNLLGVRRDLLTAVAYGVTELLFVYGDDPQEGERAPMTVKRMLAEARELAPGLRIGVTATCENQLPSWKRAADFVCLQMSFDPLKVMQWRDEVAFDGQVFAGVVVLASDKMATRLLRAIPNFSVPASLMERLARDSHAGVDAAIEMVMRLHDDATVEGVHLVPARRYRETAAALEGVGL